MSLRTGTLATFYWIRVAGKHESGDTETRATFHRVRVAKGLQVFLWGIERIRKRDYERGGRLTSNISQMRYFYMTLGIEWALGAHTISDPPKGVGEGRGPQWDAWGGRWLFNPGNVWFEIRTFIKWYDMLNHQIWCLGNEFYKRRYLVQNETDNALLNNIRVDSELYISYRMRQPW